MVAPPARSAVETVHGVAPFVYEKDGVQGEPNKMFTRSLWTYDTAQTGLQGVVDSMRRVVTFASALAAGDTLGPSAPPVPSDLEEIEEFFGNELRPSKISSRFVLWPDVFKEQPSLGASAIEYDERYFFSIFSPIPGVLMPSDFFKVELFGLTSLSCSIGKSLHFDFSSMDPANHEDTTGDDWVPLVPPTGFLPFQLFHAGYVAEPSPLIFLNDGTDGNPPVPLGLGRTVDEQLAYVQNPKNASSLYFGYAVFNDAGTGGSTAPSVLSLGVPYSASMGHG